MNRCFPVLFLLLCSLASAQDVPVDLIRADAPRGGWSFNNGQEFPGAKGDLQLDEEAAADRKPALRLLGDFSGGGAYVQVSCELPKKPAKELSFWIKAPGAEKLTMRLVDGSDQCHQINLRLRKSDDWQEVRLPFKEFFRLMSEGTSIDGILQYEKWGGANDSRWHDPGKLVCILAGAHTFPGTKKGVVGLSGVKLTLDAPEVKVEKSLRLDDLISEGTLDWSLSLGDEFPGAKGKLELAKDENRNVMRVAGDFTGGGGYIAALRSLKEIGASEMRALRFKMKSQTVRSYSIRFVDGSGQCFQKKGVPFEADGAWHEVVLKPQDFAGGEHWGGANDGRWHGAANDLALMLTPTSNPQAKSSEALICDLSADVTIQAKAGAQSYREGFEGDALPKGWTTRGAATLDRAVTAKGRASLKLERSLERLNDPTGAAGAAFPASAGLWNVEGSVKADLKSPDNSYNGTVYFEALDAAGGVAERFELNSTFGGVDWKPFSKQIDLPARTAAARFAVELQKSTGSFWIDELVAARMVSDEKRVERIVISTERLGNLFFPEDPRKVRVSVESPKPLRDAERAIRWVVTDYWGVEQTSPARAELAKAGRANNRFAYEAELDLGPVPMETGRYYELHVDVLAEGRPASESSGIAVLPTAESKRLKPEEVPFTIRNWDSRIPVYFDLADRLGIRQLGLWAGWDAKAPYKPYCHGVDAVRKLGAGWVGGLEPVSWVESEGFKKIDEEGLRQGVRNWVKQFGSEGRIMVCLGNEPHGARAKVKENVRAYKAVYEAAKEVDPKILVVSTSVEVNRDYWEEGYYKYCDAYDFHIYESYQDVRKTIREYKALMKEFGAEKPILSTELGLNSQGQTRMAVSCELVKKTVAMFAEGGVSTSWFTIQYPDPEGKARGQSGDAHCVFDCKYSKYNPRLDAITLYTMVGGVAGRKFAAEKQYEGGVQAFLFRDAEGRSMQILWKDDGRRDVSVPLPGIADVELVRLDGGRAKLTPKAGALTLGISAEPVLLFYRDRSGKLAEKLGEAAFSLASAPDSGVFSIRGAAIKVLPPPRWTANVRAASGLQECRVAPPADTGAREGRIIVQAADGSGELVVPIRLARP